MPPIGLGCKPSSPTTRRLCARGRSADRVRNRSRCGTRRGKPRARTPSRPDSRDRCGTRTCTCPPPHSLGRSQRNRCRTLPRAACATKPAPTAVRIEAALVEVARVIIATAEQHAAEQRARCHHASPCLRERVAAMADQIDGPFVSHAPQWGLGARRMKVFHAQWPDRSGDRLRTYKGVRGSRPVSPMSWCSGCRRRHLRRRSRCPSRRCHPRRCSARRCRCPRHGGRRHRCLR